MSAEVPLKLSLQAANPAEAQTTWEDPEVCLSPFAFASWLVRHLSIDAEQLNSIAESVVFSGTEPTAQDAKKIWVKTSTPYGIGFFAGGQWRVINDWPKYGLFHVPDDVSTPTYIKTLSEAEITARGLQSVDGFKWVYHS